MDTGTVLALNRARCKPNIAERPFKQIRSQRR
jgi:hypothetical protein